MKCKVYAVLTWYVLYLLDMVVQEISNAELIPTMKGRKRQRLDLLGLRLIEILHTTETCYITSLSFLYFESMNE